ncbi:hypothetical protein EYF80_005599 [Liparis tanakae]|uniref:Uncharacterized protein n=1 Tax=Liparis tanakae TaxID=230148 RepID=A0A4Z2J483_9TELE|nr:hypothetical protein EYF80_005599 [Liparis tanakae]
MSLWVFVVIDVHQDYNNVTILSHYVGANGFFACLFSADRLQCVDEVFQPPQGMSWFNIWPSGNGVVFPKSMSQTSALQNCDAFRACRISVSLLRSSLGLGRSLARTSSSSRYVLKTAGGGKPFTRLANVLSAFHDIGKVKFHQQVSQVKHCLSFSENFFRMVPSSAALKLPEMG